MFSKWEGELIASNPAKQVEPINKSPLKSTIKLLASPISIQVDYRSACDLREVDQSCNTTLKSELLICRPPLYLTKPNFLNLFMKKFTRERVEPIVSASIS